jgi:hypothetical protein
MPDDPRHPDAETGDSADETSTPQSEGVNQTHEDVRRAEEEGKAAARRVLAEQKETD